MRRGSRADYPVRIGDAALTVARRQGRRVARMAPTLKAGLPRRPRATKPAQQAGRQPAGLFLVVRIRYASTAAGLEERP